MGENQNHKFATSRTGQHTPRTARTREVKKSRVLTAILKNSKLSYHPKVFYAANKFKFQDLVSPATNGTVSSFDQTYAESSFH